MANLPHLFSVHAAEIQGAISEGRTEDAKRLAAGILAIGNADSAVQKIAAELLRPSPKGRGRPTSLPKHWIEIAQEYEEERHKGNNHELALEIVAKYFGYSPTHVDNCRRAYEQTRIET